MSNSELDLTSPVHQVAGMSRESAGWVDRIAARLMLPRVLADLEAWRVGRLTVVLPDGSLLRAGEAGGAPHVTLRVHSPALFRKLALAGELGAGESYVDGDWTTDDLPRLLELALRNAQSLPLESPLTRLTSTVDRWRHHRRRNTKTGSRRNIAAHYDLSNEFFGLFLDPSLTYSAAVFESPGDTLEQAQRLKYRLLARHLDIRPGHRVLEIGCGWGGFAEFAAGELGARITAITVSRRQCEYARRRLARAGLDDHAAIELCDYRDVSGRFDRIVSIEMLEAVGRDYWDAFFAACDRVLAPGGRLGVQVITMPDHRFDAYARRADWIQKHIFPGGMLPSFLELCRSAARTTSLGVRHVQDIALDYARTLSQWRLSFLGALPEVARLGFDARFVRTWEYYLASCEALFATRSLGTLQVVWDRSGEDRR
jgi:cyclopropane-fatty-acyl-phospholipid synthase